MRKRLISLLALSVAIALFVAACGGGGSHKNSLGGKILIAETAFKHSTVSLSSTKKAGGHRVTKTDTAGQYSFENVPAGSYMLSIAFGVSNGTCAVVDGVHVKEHGDQTKDLVIVESDLQNLVSGLGMTSGGAIIRCK